MSCTTKSRNRYCSPCSLFWGDYETKDLPSRKKKTSAEFRGCLRNKKSNQGKIIERGRGWIKRASVSCQRATFSKQVELSSRPVQSLMEPSFNSAFITVFFLPGHAGRVICLFPSSVSLIWMYAVVTVRSGQQANFGLGFFSLISKKNSTVFKKSQVSSQAVMSRPICLKTQLTVTTYDLTNLE